MSREEAIKELKESHDIMRSYDVDESESRLMIALNMAIQALQAQAEKTCDLEKSNFSKEQYKLDTDTAYKCGYCADTGKLRAFENGKQRLPAGKCDKYEPKSMMRRRKTSDELFGTAIRPNRKRDRDDDVCCD